MKYNSSEREIPAYKKKAKNTGLPRSKHKHVYETVLLTSDYHHTDLRTGAPKVTHNFTPTKVCTICGRVDSRDNDTEYYIIREVPTSLPFVFHSKELSEKAFKLPKWYLADFWDKFAVQISEDEFKDKYNSKGDSTNG